MIDSEEQNQEMVVELAKASLLSKARTEQEIENFAEEVEGQLAVDVRETPDEFVIQSAVAGVDPEELDVSITSDAVHVSGRRESSEKGKEGSYIYQECYWGRFSRSVALSQEVDADRAAASIKNGVLTIHLPKLHREKSKKLKVRPD